MKDEQKRTANSIGKYFLLYTLLLFQLNTVFSQTQEVKFDSDKNQVMVDTLMARHDYQRAIDQLHEHINIYEAGNDTENIIASYNKLSFSFLQLYKYEDSKKAIDKAILLIQLNPTTNLVEKIKSLENLGTYYIAVSDPESALRNLKEALKLRLNSRVSNDEGLVHSYLKIASAHHANNQLDSAQVLLTNTKTRLDQMANPADLLEARYLESIALLHQSEREEKKAISYYQKALEIHESKQYPDALKIAAIESRLGNAYYFLFDYVTARKYLEKSTKTYLEHIGENNGVVAENYTVLGRIYAKSSQFTKAVEYNKKGLAISKSRFGEQSWQVGLANAIIGITYGRMYEFEASLRHYEKANELFIKNLGEDHRWVVTTYENIGRTYNRLKMYDASLKNFEIAIELGKNVLGENHPTVAHVYLNAADTYAALEMNEKAIELYENALEIHIKKYGPKHREVAQNYIGMADFYNHIREFEKASANYDKVLSMYDNEIQSTLKADFAKEEINVLYKVLEAFEGKAKNSLDLYKLKKKVADLEVSREAYEKADIIGEKMRKSISEFEDKVAIAEENQIGALGSIETNYLLFQEKGEAANLKRAFYFSEKNRAAALDELLARSNQNVVDGPFKDLIFTENLLKKKRAEYLSNIRNEEMKTNPSEIDSVYIEFNQNNLFKTRRSLDSLDQILKEKYPQYFGVTNKTNLLKVDEIQSRLDNETTFIEYFVADSTSTYAFVLTANKFVVERLSTSGVKELITNFNNTLREKNIKGFKESSSALYKMLVGPIKPIFAGHKLTIVPYGSLWHINFDLLLEKNDSSANPALLSYLLRKYAISYANSANTLSNLDHSNQKKREECLAFSFKNEDAVDSGSQIKMATMRNTNEDLPGTRKEIKAISNILKGDYFYGTQAMEAHFKNNAANYKVLHLALHGEVDNENPENSKLFFSNKKDSLEDNILYSHELFTLNIPAELVVLSACNSGTGKTTSGEGIMSLGNAFQYAGAKSLLMTHWEVSDEITPIIMEYFYANLNEGMNKATALQQAKLSYLKDADVFRSNPFYWGSFYLVGDSSPMRLGKATYSIYIWLAVLFLFVVFLWFRYQKRS